MRGKGSPELRAMGWETLLQMWGLLLDYYDVPDQPPDDRDIASWYGEQTLNGLLAAAVWKIPGGWSLQEFTGEKTPQAKKQSKRRRGDIWLGFEKQRRTFTIEAKVAWLNSTASQAAVKEIASKLTCAWSQLDTLHKSHAKYCEGCPMAVVYAVPWLPANVESSNEDRVKRLFIDIPKQFSNPTTLTAVYRCQGDWPKWMEKKYGDRVYPGVIFIGKYWTSFTGEDFQKMRWS
jgi:hypothetical protein